jgi:hypothetical protein
MCFTRQRTYYMFPSDVMRSWVSARDENGAVARAVANPSFNRYLTPVDKANNARFPCANFGGTEKIDYSNVSLRKWRR